MSIYTVHANNLTHSPRLVALSHAYTQRRIRAQAAGAMWGSMQHAASAKQPAAGAPGPRAAGPPGRTPGRWVSSREWRPAAHHIELNKSIV
eukprot:scaffold9892_cov126-Isochrysis_galbana.AAC.4